jgi:hypothetical protein
MKQWPNRLRNDEREHPGFALSRRKCKIVEKNSKWGT